MRGRRVALVLTAAVGAWVSFTARPVVRAQGAAQGPGPASAAAAPSGRGQRGGRGGRRANARKRYSPGPIRATDRRSMIRSRMRWRSIERLGYESGVYDTYIRTDSNIISNSPLEDRREAGERRPGPEQRRRDLLLGHSDVRSTPGRRPTAVVREGRREGVRRGAHGDDRVRIVAGIRRDARRALRRAPIDGPGTVINEDPAFPRRSTFPACSISPTSSISGRTSRATRSTCCCGWT